MIELHEHGQPYDARRRKNRSACACNHVFEAFDNWLDIFDACPNPQIASFDLAQNPVDASGQFDK
jgi:hypothetical protein